MEAFDARLGGCMAAIAALFALGLMPGLAPRVYRGRPGFARRLAAPAIFGILAIACFSGLGLPTFIAVALAGLALITVARVRAGRTAPVA
jgi:hypothetical protein